jgi:hypothetical protein
VSVTKTEREFPPAAEHLYEELQAQESGTDQTQHIRDREERSHGEILWRTEPASDQG